MCYSIVLLVLHRAFYNESCQRARPEGFAILEFMSAKTFPEGFYWGAATASYQVEGGIENTDWAKAAIEGRVPPCGASSDHYHRYIQDFDIAKTLGHNAHRLSIEWARVEPEEGKFDEMAIAHYRQVLLALRDRGITPFVTIWHFTLPLWFSEAGGFEQKNSPEVFARYATYVVEQLGDLCEHFSTMNEPNVWAGHGWIYGAWPPFKRAKLLWKSIGKEDGTSKSAKDKPRNAHFFDYLRVEKNLIKAHKLTYKKIKKIRPDVKISLVKHVRVFRGKHFFHRPLAQLMQYFQTHRFLRAVARSLDEIGLNYYRITIFGDKRTWRKTDMGWTYAPEYIYEALKELGKYQLPIFVSEAGLADADDSDRAEYIQKQVEATWRAIEDGVDVRGHLYWSLLDNYEWALGYEKRFGLIEVNYQTMERKIRPSAYVYKEICDGNCVVEYIE
jgi:beta-glucosidase